MATIEAWVDARMSEWDRAHGPATRYANGHFMSAVARAVSVRAGGTAGDPFPAHAWPGGYPITYLSEMGYQYCPKCAAQEADPPIVTCEISWEGPDDHCDGCGAVLPTAYGDPDAPEAEPDASACAGCNHLRHVGRCPGYANCGCILAPPEA